MFVLQMLRADDLSFLDRLLRRRSAHKSVQLVLLALPMSLQVGLRNENEAANLAREVLPSVAHGLADLAPLAVEPLVLVDVQVALILGEKFRIDGYTFALLDDDRPIEKMRSAAGVPIKGEH